MLMSPWWWLACSSIVIPLIIHWLNQSRVQQIKFGHLPLVPKQQQQQHRRRRLQHWLLLLIRMLLLLIATFLAGQLTLSALAPPSSPINVVSPAWLQAATDDQRQQLAEQWQAGQSIWVVADSPYKWHPDDARTAASTLPFNARLSQFLANQPGNTPVNVYVTDNASQSGLLPLKLAQPIQWHISHSDSQPKQPAPIKVLVLGTASQQEYLLAALHALQQQFDLDIEQRDSMGSQLSSAQQFNWIFVADIPSAPLRVWLENAVNNGAVVLNYPANTKLTEPQVVYWPGNDKGFFNLYQNGSLAQLASSQGHSEVIWRSAQGMALLTRQFIGQGQWLRLILGLTPQSAQWVTSGYFPRWLASLMLDADSKQHNTHNESTTASKSVFTNESFPFRQSSGWPLYHYLAIPLLLLWLLERLLASRLRQGGIDK